MGFNGKTSKRHSVKCAGCGTEFTLLEHQYQYRKLRSLSGKLYCSRQCVAKPVRVEIKEAV